MENYQPYLVSYRHNDREWNVEIMAVSFADARERLAKLALGRVEGVVTATIPSPLGSLVPLITLWKRLVGG